MTLNNRLHYYEIVIACVQLTYSALYFCSVSVRNIYLDPVYCAAINQPVTEVRDLSEEDSSIVAEESPAVETPPETETVGTNKVLTIRVPGSVANLGPAFDCVAIAVKLHLNVTIAIQPPSKSGQVEIVPKGAIAQQLPLDNTNYLARVIQKMWPQDPAPLSCFRITVESDVPVAMGLGSSAAASVVGTTAVMALCGQALQKTTIFSHAAELEGYPSNACAAVFGGFTISGAGPTPEELLARKIIWPENWHLLATIPPYTLPSKKTRSTLPASVSYRDAIYNVQRTAFLVEAVAAADNEAMKSALRDKLHEPFQSKLVPEFAEVKRALRGCDVLGTVLSGGGPTIITIVDTEHLEETWAQLKRWGSTQVRPPVVVELPLDDEGLVVTCE